MRELVSVIVCTYNQESTIARALEGILRQKCHVPIEIIIGEDCSSDCTLEICRQYAEKYPDVIRLLANHPNKGIVENYFGCLLKAQGKYIADCAGDDEWSDSLKLEKEVCIMEGHPDVTLVHTDYLCRDATSGCISSPHPHPCFHIPQGETQIIDGKELLIPILTQLKRPVIHLCTALYRTEVMLRAYEQYRPLIHNKAYGCEDVQVCFMLAMTGKVAYINEPTLYYTIGGKTISCTHDEEKQFHFVKGITQLEYDLAQTFGIKDERLKSHFEYRISALLMHAFRCHSNALRTEALTFPDTWNTRLNLKAKIVKFFTSFSWLWSFALNMRKLIVSDTH
jgi:glycosyltransferase involved in cell wall biosynthesis